MCVRIIGVPGELPVYVCSVFMYINLNDKKMYIVLFLIMIIRIILIFKMISSTHHYLSLNSTIYFNK